MKTKYTGGNVKADWSFIVIIITVMLILCLFWSGCLGTSRNNKVYSMTNKKNRESVVKEYEDTPKFSVKTRNKDKTFSKKEMLIESSDLLYYKTIKADPKTSFIFREQNINMPYRTNADVGGVIHDINNYDLVDNTVYDEIFNPVRNAAGEMIEIFGEEEGITAQRNLQVELRDADSQNVHDTSVSRTVRKIFATIDIKNSVNENKLVKDILTYAEDKEVSGNATKKIKMVLDKVLNRNAVVTNIGGAREIELLDAVWREASIKNEPTRSNIRDMLLVQIADTFDENTRSVLCPSGFANRISVALVVETPSLFPKTKELLNNEILQTASFIRNELEEDNDYKLLNDFDQHEVFKKELYDKLSLDYMGFLSIEEIKDLTADWIDHL